MRVSVDKLRVWLLLAAAVLVCVIVAFLGYAQYRMHRVVRDIPRRLGMDIQQETNHFTYVQTLKGRTIFSIHAAKMVQMKTGGKVSLHDVDITLYGGKGDRTDHISGSEFDYDTVNQVMTATGEVHIDLQAPPGAEGNGSTGAKTGTENAAADASAAGEKSKKAADGGPGTAGTAGTAATAEQIGPGVIHVKTSGLVFLEKLAVAATAQEVEFQFNGVTGHAHGAEYDTDKGVLILQSAVQMNTLTTGRPVVLTASHAEMMRDSNQAVLTDAAYVSPDVDGKSQSGKAGSATIHMRRDGTVERVDASGDVTLQSEDGGTVSAPQAQATMNAASQPRNVDLSGGVRFDSASRGGSDAARGPGVSAASLATGDGEQAHGVAREAHIVFGAKGRMQQVRLLHAVRLTERVAEERRSGAQAASPSHGGSTGRSTGPNAEGGLSAETERDLRAEDVRVAFQTGATGHAEARQVKAIGGSGNPAQLRITTQTLEGGVGKSTGSRAGAGRQPSHVALQQLRTERTLLSADELNGDLSSSSEAARFSRIQGTGHTVFTQESADGSTQTSTGDRLDLKLASAGGPAASGGGMDVESGTQQGHVRITQTPARSTRTGAQTAGRTASQTAAGAAAGTQRAALSASGSGVTTATADLAQYHGASQQLELTGSPQVAGGGMTLWARKIVLARLTGDVSATGDVKGSLERQENSSGPSSQAANVQTHIVADRALLRRAEQRAFFYGSNSREARLWQGASQVQAPMLVFDQGAQTLTAVSADAADGSGPGQASGQGSGRAAVHAVFLSAAGSQAGKPALAKSSANRKSASRAQAGAAPAIVRVASRRMVYSDQKHEADFSGAVLVESADGSMHASSAVVTLQAPAAGGRPGPQEGVVPVGLFGGSVERVVAQGDVSLNQPGRKATGDRLTYTAADGEFKLTGTASRMPRLVDQVNGTVSGAALIFHSGDDSVIISSGESGGKVRTRTETTVKP